MDASARRLLSVLGGLSLIAFGLLTLVFQLLQIDFWSFAWPLFPMVPGLLFFGAMVGGGRDAAGLAIPGSILVALGLIFFYQNALNQWQSWAYAWALLWPTAVGIGLLLQGRWAAKQHLVQAGKRLIRTGLLIFLAGVVFFELILGIGGWGLGAWGLSAYILPTLLLATGAVLLVRSLSPARKGASEVPSQASEEHAPAGEE